jgi:hypothetical protein
MYIDDSQIEATGLRLGQFLALAKSNRTKNEAQQVEAPDAE